MNENQDKSLISEDADEIGVKELIVAILDQHKDEEIRNEDLNDNFALPDANDGEDTDRYTRDDEEELVRKNRGLIEWVAAKYAVPCSAGERSTEQMCYSAAYFGFLKAIRSYHFSYATQPGGCTFGTWATRCMHNQICSEIRQHNRSTWRQDSLEGNVPNSNRKKPDESVPISSTLESGFNVEEEAIKNIRIQSMLHALNMLEPIEKDIITLLFGIGREKVTQDMVALKYHVSQANISKKKQDILDKLKYILMSTFGITSAG